MAQVFYNNEKDFEASNSVKASCVIKENNVRNNIYFNFKLFTR